MAIDAADPRFAMHRLFKLLFWCEQAAPRLVLQAIFSVTYQALLGRVLGAEQASTDTLQ